MRDHVYGKPKGELVPAARFSVGEWSDAALASLQKYIPDISAADKAVTISGRALKHADEGHHEDVKALEHELPAAIREPQEFLHNPKRPDSVYLVHEVAGKNYLVVLELAHTREGTEVVNMFTTKANKLNSLREKSNAWLEGRNPLHRQLASQPPPRATISGAQPGDTRLEGGQVPHRPTAETAAAPGGASGAQSGRGNVTASAGTVKGTRQLQASTDVQHAALLGVRATGQKLLADPHTPQEMKGLVTNLLYQRRPQ